MSVGVAVAVSHGNLHGFPMAECEQCGRVSVLAFDFGVCLGCMSDRASLRGVEGALPGSGVRL